MPKIVDHEARRAELAAAVWSLIGRGGVEAASVRAVAAESGWSMGAVRHYFATQDELLLFSGEVMSQRVGDRIRGLYLPDAPTPPGPERAFEALEQLLPLDENRTVEVLVWLAFMTRARTDDRYDALREAGWAGERFICRVAAADLLGLPLPTEVAASFDDPAAEEVVDRIHVIVDGFSLQAATYPEHWTPEHLRSALRLRITEAARVH